MDFYYLPLSSPCRSIIMLAKALGIELNKKILRIHSGEQLTPEFLKLNPQHTIPTLVDNGFSIWESRAILIYLVEKYGKDDSLYPKDPQQRAVINQRLYFDMGTLYQSYADYFYPQFNEKKAGDPELEKKLHVALDFLNTFLEGHSYVAGDKLTVADFAILATISTFVVSGVELSAHPNVAKWYELLQKVIPGWEENWEGCQVLKEYFFNK